MKSMKKGFTLIELLVVIAIIGILAATVLIGMRSARGKARDSARKTDISTIITALETSYDDTESYPAVTAGGCHSTSATAGVVSVADLFGTGMPLVGKTLSNSDNTYGRYDDSSVVTSGSVIATSTDCTAAAAGQGPMYIGVQLEQATTKGYERTTAQ